MRLGTNADRDRGSRLDELVPVAGGRTRRVVLWTGFLSIVAATVWAWTTGTATPLLDGSGVSSYGGDGPVHIGLRLHNSSRVDIEIVGGPHARPGLRLLGYTLDGAGVDEQGQILRSALDPDPFPIRLHADQERALSAWYEPVDCAAIRGVEGHDRRIDLQTKVADGPFSMVTRRRSIPSELVNLDGGRATDSPWPVVISQYACGFTTI